MQLDLAPDSRRANLLFAAAAVLLILAFAAQLAFHAIRTGVTLDEPAHILAGHRHLQCADFGINPEHPPLLKLLSAVPLAFRDLKEPPWECGSKMTSKFDSFTYGSSFLVDNDIDSVVIPTRLAASLMSLLLAILVFIAAWEMFGRWEAITALAILAFEPNLIAHGSIVTTDMAISAAVFAAIYSLYRFGNRANLPRFLIAGLAFGLLLSAKHSAVIFLPSLFVLLMADAHVFHMRDTSVTKLAVRRVAAFAGIFTIGWIMLWACYGFRYYATPAATQDSVSIADYIKENGRPGTAASVPARVTDMVSHMHVFPESYVLGMADVIAWGTRNTWIFGTNYPTGQSLYFPLALVVKSSLALLLLLPVGLLLLILEPAKSREFMFLLVPALFYFLVAMSSSFTTGVRHILPIYPLLIVAAAAGAVWLCRKLRFFRYVLVALLIYNAAAAVRTAPNHIAFANDFWGGYQNTHRIFSDSNVETGHALKQINDYIERENVGECWIVAFVHPEILRSVQPCRVMPSNLRILISRDALDPIPPVVEGTFFVTIGDLPPRGGDEYTSIAQSEPVAFLGGNVYVYRGRFEVPLASAISHVQRSAAFLRMGRTVEAVAEARTAVEFGTNDPRTHLALGLALLGAGEKSEGRKELETTIELARRDPRFKNNENRAIQELDRLNN